MVLNMSLKTGDSQPSPIPLEDLNLINALNELGKLSDLDKPSKVRILNNGGTFNVMVDLSPGVKKTTEKIKRMILKNEERESLDDLKETQKLFRTVKARCQALKGNEEILQHYQKAVSHAYEGLKKLYEMYRSDSSSKAMIYRNDILEAVSVAFEVNGLNEILLTDNKIERIAADRLKPLGEQLKAYHIPLFRSEDLDKVASLMKQKFPDPTKPPTLKEIQKDPDLKTYLVKEDVAMGRMVEGMYKHRKIGKFLNNRVISWALTSFMGWHYKRQMQEGTKRTEAVLKFFQKMHISLSTEHRGSLYSYREMFGRNIREEKSLDEAFQRPLTPEATAMLMEEANKEKERIISEIGPQGSLVISNSYSRVRVKEIAKGNAKTMMAITGKSLSESPANIKAAKNEISYAGKFEFSIQNMLGNENDVETSFTKDTIVGKDKLHTINEAEYLYRCCLTNAINREDTMMVVQRLAPADIHHYAESVGGQVLNIKESCQELWNLLSTTENEAEKKQLEILIKKFEEEGEDYLQKGTVEVKGTRMSVSTLATKYQSPLSQNDRKIMMVKHVDGSIAIHTFIGAVGVNNVKVTAGAGNYEIGSDYGSMGFGDEEKMKRKAWIGMATAKDSIRIRQRTGQKVEMGKEIGEFSKEGSTVVSLYFKKNFIPTERIKTAIHALHYQEKTGMMEREIEIQSKLGDIVGHPTAYVAMKAIENSLIKLGIDRRDYVYALLKQGKSIQDIHQALLVIYQDVEPSSEFEKRLSEALKALDPDQDQMHLVETLHKNLERWIQIRHIAYQLMQSNKEISDQDISNAIMIKDSDEKMWWKKEIKKEIDTLRDKKD